MKNTLNGIHADIDYARKCINQVAKEVRAAYQGESDALTVAEVKSDGGILLASALFGLERDIEKASNALFQIMYLKKGEN